MTTAAAVASSAIQATGARIQQTIQSLSPTGKQTLTNISAAFQTAGTNLNQAVSVLSPTRGKNIPSVIRQQVTTTLTPTKKPKPQQPVAVHIPYEPTQFRQRYLPKTTLPDKPRAKTTMADIWQRLPTTVQSPLFAQEPTILRTTEVRKEGAMSLHHLVQLGHDIKTVDEGFLSILGQQPVSHWAHSPQPPYTGQHTTESIGELFKKGGIDTTKTYTITEAGGTSRGSVYMTTPEAHPPRLPSQMYTREQATKARLLQEEQSKRQPAPRPGELTMNKVD